MGINERGQGEPAFRAEDAPVQQQAVTRLSLKHLLAATGLLALGCLVLAPDLQRLSPGRQAVVIALLVAWLAIVCATVVILIRTRAKWLRRFGTARCLCGYGDFTLEFRVMVVLSAGFTTVFSAKTLLKLSGVDLALDAINAVVAFLFTVATGVCISSIFYERPYCVEIYDQGLRTEVTPFIPWSRVLSYRLSTSDSKTVLQGQYTLGVGRTFRIANFKARFPKRHETAVRHWMQVLSGKPPEE